MSGRFSSCHAVPKNSRLTKIESRRENKAFKSSTFVSFGLPGAQASAKADSARNSIILTDSSKFSEHGVVMQCRLKDINMVFTDDQVPLEAKDAMEQNGIIVETVPR